MCFLNEAVMWACVSLFQSRRASLEVRLLVSMLNVKSPTSNWACGYSSQTLSGTQEPEPCLQFRSPRESSRVLETQPRAEPCLQFESPRDPRMSIFSFRVLESFRDPAKIRAVSHRDLGYAEELTSECFKTKHGSDLGWVSRTLEDSGTLQKIPSLQHFPPPRPHPAPARPRCGPTPVQRVPRLSSSVHPKTQAMPQ